MFERKQSVKKEDKKSFWEEYGLFLTLLGFGLAFMFFLVIVYLVWTRPSSKSQNAPHPSQPYPIQPVQRPSSSPIPNSSVVETPPPMDYDISPMPPSNPMYYGEPTKINGGKKKVGKGKKLKGGCGCAGIADIPK